MANSMLKMLESLLFMGAGDGVGACKQTRSRPKTDRLGNTDLQWIDITVPVSFKKAVQNSYSDVPSFSTYPPGPPQKASKALKIDVHCSYRWPDPPRAGTVPSVSTYPPQKAISSHTSSPAGTR